MGNVSKPNPVTLIAAIMAPDPETIQTAKGKLCSSFGEIDLKSEAFQFDFSRYYEREMGRGLIKEFISFSDLVEPGSLAEIKLFTNGIESELADTIDGNLRRRANIDPGYVTLGNLVLASTKDAGHRIYIGQGIYAELTLRFLKGSFRELEWTYRDYATDFAIGFFNSVRERLLTKLRQIGNLV